MTRSRRVFALDLGTTKVCCAIAELDSTGLRVIGVGEAPSRGVRKGSIIEIDRAAEAVAEAVDLAEQMSGVPVDSAVVGLAGTSITSQNSRGVVAVSAGHREVRDADVTRAVEAARAVSVPSDRKILHVLPQQFTIDGQEGVRDALGMAGTRLEVDAHIITGTTTAIQNMIKVVHKAGLDVEDLVLQVLASAEAVIGEDELDRGVVVADIGGGTTDVAVFAKGSIIHTAVIPVGGNHVSGDMAVGLRCDLETAEATKRAYGHCLQLTLPADAEVKLLPMGYDEPVNVPQRFLAEIIGPRAREMAQLIAEQVEMAGPPSSFPGGIVLTGGGALLRGFAEVIQQVTDLPARVAAPHGVTGMNDEISGPNHATVVGLLRWGARGRLGRGVQLTGRAQNGNGQHVSDRFGRWIRELF
ncbi:MAG TPA: cell division protein FtsA [Candidatus Dormibacteraeota bacterium]|nr:cell division protein FtsA [Candidatus Dormibacteraeota bacterium]